MNYSCELKKRIPLFFEVGNVDRNAYFAELEAKRDRLDNHIGNC